MKYPSIILSGNPPPPSVQRWNKLYHQEPYNTIAWTAFWAFGALFLAPVAGFVLIFIGLARLAVLKWTEEELEIASDQELAIVITGCDSGFGKDLALRLARKKFHVFAGCLLNESFPIYEKTDNVMPLKIDVTQESDISIASKVVRMWMEDRNAKKKRYLHAIVNNAGIGSPGWLDWLEVKHFERDMNVNFFGQVRMVKAFYDLYKKQVFDYKSARIVNVSSLAGLVTGPHMAPYFCSKHAAEAFTSTLRLEMDMIGVKVIGVNPSFHGTKIVSSAQDSFRALLNSIPEQKQKEYGEDFCATCESEALRLPNSLLWEADVVVDQLVRVVTLVRPPMQIFVGGEVGGYLMARFLPVWLQHFLKPSIDVKPAYLNKKQKKE